jgi:hypothetical protein
VVELDQKQAVAGIKELFRKMPWIEKIGVTEKQCLDEIDLIVLNIKDRVPEKLQLPSKEIDDDQTVEVERQAETATERETELEVEEETGRQQEKIISVTSNGLQECASFIEAKEMSTSHYSSHSGQTLTYRLEKTPVFPLVSYLKTDSELQSCASAFGGIYLAFNVLDQTSIKDVYRLLGPHRMAFHHLLIKDSRVTVLTQEEARLVRNSPDYYNLTLGFNDPDRKLSTSERFKTLKIKFLNGESQYSREELDLLKKWFKSQGTTKMRTLFLDHVLKGQPRKAGRYQGSPLQSLLSAV